MKKILLLSLLTCLQVKAQESILQNSNTKEVVIEDNTYDLDVDLNEKTVLCLKGDYTAPSFKIAIPGINNITYLDHTSPGAPGPCINAGYCREKEGDAFAWGALVDFRFPIFHDLNKPIENVQIRVIRKEVLILTENKRCLRYYVEAVSSTIRGTLFQHEASIPLASGPAEMCN